MVLIVAGFLTALSGLAFALQGLGLVGPSYSFMYNNGRWVYEGSATLVIGVIIFVGGLLLKRKHSNGIAPERSPLGSNED